MLPFFRLVDQGIEIQPRECFGFLDDGSELPMCTSVQLLVKSHPNALCPVQHLPHVLSG